MGRKNKSKAPTGRAAAKQKAKRGGNGGWTPSSSRSAGWPKYGWSDDDDDNTRPAFQGFSQTHNPSTTPRNFSLRHASLKLRHQAITFVSAGTNTPDEFLPKREEQEVFVAADDSDDEEEALSEGDDIDESTMQTNIVMEAEVMKSEAAFQQMHIQSPAQARGIMADLNGDAQDEPRKDVAPETQDMPLYVVDTVGDPSLVRQSTTKGKQPAARPPSPTPSDSSEEVVVFRGRDNPAPVAKPATRTRYRDVLTPAADGGYEAQTTKTSAVQIKDQSERQAPQPIVENTQVISVQQSNAIPPHEGNRTANQSSRMPQSQQAPPTAIGWAARTSKFEDEVAPNATWAPAPAGSWWKNKSKKPRPDLDLSESEKLAIDQKARAPSKVMFIESNPTEEDIAAPQDKSTEKDAEETIASLQAEVNSMLRSKRRAKQPSREQDEMAAQISSSASTPKRRGKRGRKKDNRQMRDPIDDEDEDAGEAAYDDYMANLAAQQLNGSADGIFASTAHSNGLGPSLVIDGEEVANDEVLPGHFKMMNNSDTSSELSGPIGQDASELSSNEELDLSDLGSSELEDELEYTEREQWEDEEDLRQRRRDHMTDEQIAKLFAKQQELGIDDDDLVIDNGDYVSMSDEVDGIGDIDRARAGLANITNISFGQSNRNGVRRRSNRDFTFPDASALADTVEQYGENGFDIMDFDRPSLRQTKKGRKGNLPAELEGLSDEELRETMRTTWANDRRKKSAKKAEREELRMQGLLGAAGRSGKADLSLKYPFGMTTVQIHEELRIFLDDDNQQSRPFPPMKKNDRKALHEIAAVLKLGSKSIGTGHDRFPVLTKTTRTTFSPAALDRAIAASDKGFLGRGSKSAKKMMRQNGKTPKKAGSGFGGAAAATLRHGEVVGAGAAELGKENFGHKLMEKMGWSKGMALGKEGEGRLVPVEQKVRLGTAGLG